MAKLYIFICWDDLHIILSTWTCKAIYSLVLVYMYIKYIYNPGSFHRITETTYCTLSCWRLNISSYYALSYYYSTYHNSWHCTTQYCSFTPYNNWDKPMNCVWAWWSDLKCLCIGNPMDFGNNCISNRQRIARAMHGLKMCSRRSFIWAYSYPTPRNFVVH